MIRRLQVLLFVLAGIHPAFADVAAADPVTEMMQHLGPGTTVVKLDANTFDELGKDIRGRMYSDDFNQFIVRRPGSNIGSADLSKDLPAQLLSLAAYWGVAPFVVNNRALWPSFLLLNHLPENTPHSPDVLAAESMLQDLVGKGGPPTADWTARSRDLNRLYVEERRKMAYVASPIASAIDYRPRRSVCPTPADHASGGQTPKLASTPHSLQEYYPPELLRHGVEGYVILSLKINSSGCATEMAVAESSGSVDLDAAALSWVDTASFLPGEKDGKHVDGTTRFAVAFKLD